MWREAIGYSFEKIGFIFGFGIYPMSVILLDNFGYASTHNAYLDTFMTGGMVYVFIIIYIYYRSFKRIKKVYRQALFYVYDFCFNSISFI